MMLRLHRLWIRVTSDRRRFGALCTVILVGMLLWARVIVLSNLPRQAVATDPPMAAAAGPATSGNPEPPVIRIELEEMPVHDPFFISTAYFPKSAPLTGLDTDEEKSDEEQAERQRRARDQQLSKLRTLVGQLRLEAVMTGPPLAVISGVTYRLDETVPGPVPEGVRLRLVEVRTRSVVLQYEAHRFELKMRTPGTE